MEYSVPELGEGVYEAEIVEWLVRPGDKVLYGQNLAEVMTDKATMELPAPFAGTIETLAAEPGQTIEVGQVLLRYSPSALSEAASDELGHPVPISAAGSVARRHAGRPVPPVDEAGDGHERSAAPTKASPAVRRLARSLDIDLNDVPGNGPEGRVLIEDLGTFVKNRQPSASRTAERSTVLDFGTPGTRVKMQGVRRSIAEHMIASKQLIPHYTYVDECDVSKMVELRNALKRPLYRQQVKLTYVPFFVKAVVGALKRVPVVNASVDDEKGEIVVHDRYDIGLAMATTRGLIVPVIRDADRRGIADIAREIERLSRAAKVGSIAHDELRGSTFTISSIGNVGGLISTPIIHHPEAGILAVGRVFKRPVYNDAGEIVPARIVYLSFSFDHRIIDGSVGAIFGNFVIEQLQNPQALVGAE